MGLCVGDFDNDTELDLFITNYDADLLWRNNGDGTFTNVAEAVGVANEGVGWYASFVDYDNDGFRDLYVVNGNVDNSQKTNRNRLYHNQNGQFVERADALNVTVDVVGRGATAGDFDNDGDVDFYIVNNTSNTLCRNDITSDNNWTKVRLRGTKSNSDGIGTRVTVVTDNLIQTQELICGTGFLGSDSLELEFGLSSAYQIDSVTLTWPSGTVETYRDLPLHKWTKTLFTFVEGETVTVTVEPTGKQVTTWGRVKTAVVFQNYPNPFNPETWIPYQLFEPSDVQISIYAQTGELIRDFNLGHQLRGEKTLYWDGKNRYGEAVASGIYFYQFQAGNTQNIRKMWLMK